MLGILLQVVFTSAKAIEVAGVAPQDQHLYQPDADNTFGCLSNPSIRIPFSRVNDDYCDCPDGSDEPGTAACSNGRFWCAGSEQYIPSRLVGDGVCDYEVCCDGSDEAPGVCEDKCAEVKQKQEARRKEEENFLKEGARLRDEMVSHAQARRQELLREKTELSEKIDATNIELNGLREELAKAEAADSETNADPESLQAIVDLRNAIKDSNELIRDIETRHAMLRGAYESLNSALEQMSIEYNPNFNDPAVKDAIKKWRAHTSPELMLPPSRDFLKDLETLEKIKVADEIDAVEQTEGADWQLKLINFLPPIIAKPLFSKRSEAKGGPRVQKVEDQILELSQKLQDLESNLKLDEQLLKVGPEFWGPEEVGRSAENLCVNIQRGDFRYEACLFGTAVQVDNGHHQVQLGHSTGLKPDGSIEFVGGNSCPNGVQRSVSLYLECGHNTEAYSVEEPDICHYVMKAKSPIVCAWEKKEEPKETSVHDEL